MANDTVYADLLDSLSPLTKAGIDPDAARMDRAGTMAKLMGTDAAAPQSWVQQAQAQQPPEDQVAQNDAPPQLSPNGNALPPGLHSRVSPPAPPSAPPAAAPAAVPGSVTPSGDPKNLAAGNAASIGLMQNNLARASQDVQNEASQPDLATATKNLEAQRQNAAQPVNAYDPQTGKLLDEYKPSFGQRLIRGVEGFARGGVLGAVDPKLAGAPAYGAPNDQYRREVQQKQQIVGSLDQQLKQAADNYKATSERLTKIASDRRALATTGKDVTGASIAQQDQPNKDLEAQARMTEANNNSPEAKGRNLQAQYEQLQHKADDLNLKGQQRTLFLANGKIPDPRQATAEEIARAQATAAWHRDNPGKQPTLDDIRTINAAVSGSEVKGNAAGKPFPPALAARISGQKSTAMKVAQAKLNSGMDPKTGQKYDKSDFVQEMNQAQNAYEEAIEAAGGSVNHMTMGDDMNWKAESPSSTATKETASTPAPKTPPAGAPQQPGEVAVISPDGTPGYIPASKLSKALAHGYKQPAGE